MNRLYQGGMGSGAPLHSHVAAWNIVFTGVKKWILFPPGHLRYSWNRDGYILETNKERMREEGYTFNENESPYQKYASSHGWGEGIRFDESTARRAIAEGLAVEVLQMPGDILFIPSNWGHATMNLCETVSMAQEFGCLDDHTYSVSVLN